jgi:hypothetical protein
MSLATTAILIAVLDLAVIVAVAAVMYLPFTLDRRSEPASVHILEAPAPLDLAA